MTYRASTVRLSAEQVSRLEAESRRLNCSTGEIIRRAVDQYLTGQKLIADSDLRLRRICEYAQLALDTIIKEDHPDFREILLSETSNRMERFHGAR